MEAGNKNFATASKTFIQIVIYALNLTQTFITTLFFVEEPRLVFIRDRVMDLNFNLLQFIDLTENPGREQIDVLTQILLSSVPIVSRPNLNASPLHRAIATVGQSSLLQALEAIMERQRVQSQQSLEEKLNLITTKNAEMRETIVRIEEKQKEQGEKIDGILLNSGRRRKKRDECFRREILIQVDLMETFLTFDVIHRANRFILYKYICKTVEEELTPEGRLFSVLDLLKFAPDSKNRRKSRQTNFGTKFMSIRRSLAVVYLNTAKKGFRQHDDGCKKSR